MSIDLKYRPSSEADLVRCLADPRWRVCSGALYHLMAKADTGEGTVVPFHPNQAQMQFIESLWNRSILLKARQLGFTSLIAILWLDHALFNADQRCGIIAQDREAAEMIFRDKVKLAYERLPAVLRAAMPLARDSASELLFGHNNSSVRVATSMRSGTLNRLHISEFGKICAKFPDKAREVVTGSLPAVPLDGIAIIESTAEGREGEFFKMTERARAMKQSGTKLTKRDWRFHFFPWWREEAYSVASGPAHTQKDIDYFEQVEAKEGTVLTPGQRNWYCATRDADFGGDFERMFQEYPSTPDEPFLVSTEGTYYAVQLAAARKAGRICSVPAVDAPVNTFWDIGASDGTAIWLHQKVGLEHRFIGFIEGWGEPYSFYVKKLQAMGHMWGTHYLPHDAAHKRQQGLEVAAPVDQLRKMGLGGSWAIVPVVGDVTHGIQAVRTAFSQCWFDEVLCREGLDHLAGYRKTWNERGSCWSDQPRHDIHSEGADAFRQWAQALDRLGGQAPAYDFGPGIRR